MYEYVCYWDYGEEHKRVFWFRKEEALKEKEIKEARKQNKIQEGRCSSSPHLPQPMLEFDMTPHPFRNKVVKDPIKHEERYVKIPENPRLGIEIDRKNILKISQSS
ncbi:hypothetical protein DRO38_07815 [Candidatus Bathyarchaeota archaeon]|nr:MAG: hypothetical protein DRO38_07815 [Candidatus Bathyarchaeota archaeon]